jgi:hypothetical protein
VGAFVSLNFPTLAESKFITLFSLLPLNNEREIMKERKKGLDKATEKIRI